MQTVVRAIRGATTVDVDSKEQVHDRTQELIGEILKRNNIDLDDLVSIVFSSTEDITSAFPATGARELGLSDVPLLDVRQPAVQGALGLCIRAMVHCYSARSRAEIHHVYLEGARVLRVDLAE